MSLHSVHSLQVTEDQGVEPRGLRGQSQNIQGHNLFCPRAVLDDPVCVG